MQYTNPILYGDYSDPDVIRVGDDFYMISSSFTYLPGIPVLHSRDLVHWTLLGYAAASLPFDRYRRPAHKCGTWAPSLRYRDGSFYVYVCLPDEGLFAFTATDPAGPWESHWILNVSGWIDPCPLFDDDGFINERVTLEQLREYIYFSETGKHIAATAEENLLGADDGIAYYLFQGRELNYEALSTIETRATAYVIYADSCTLSENFLDGHGITFKKLPRDVRRY